MHAFEICVKALDDLLKGGVAVRGERGKVNAESDDWGD